MRRLAAGVREFEELTGVRTSPGGSHTGRGTANHSVLLVPRGWEGEPLTYLEILGPDLEQDAALDDAGVDYGRVFDMSRNTPDGGLLEWRLTRRTPLAHAGAQPFLIDWGSSQHPADTLRLEAAAQGSAATDSAESDAAAGAEGVLVLERLEFYGPEPEVLKEAIRALTGESVEVAQAPEPGVRAVISGPAGEIVID